MMLMQSVLLFVDKLIISDDIKMKKRQELVVE